MAYNRDWVEGNPIDHTKFSAQPGNVRSHKVDISDRLKAMFKGFVTGDVQTDEGVINLPFNVQGSAPGATANKVKVYAKDVSSKAELFVQDEDGDEIQITTGGVITSFLRTDDLLFSFNTTTPAGFTDVSGTYNNKFFRASTGTVKSTGGSDTHDHGAATGSHVITSAEMPSHNHTFDRGTLDTSGSGLASGNSPNFGTATSSSTGSGSGHTHTISSVNNIPAFVQMRVYEKD